MGTTWQNDVYHPENGEPVDAQVAGRATRALEQRSAYLKARLEALESGEAVFLWEETVADDVRVGMPVFFNAATARFEKALAALDTDANGQLAGAASSDVIGVVAYKHNSTLADVAVAGRVVVDLTEAVADKTAGGRYYLSGMEAGKMTLQRPGVTVPVLVATGVDDVVYVNPQLRDLGDSHLHYKFDLYTQPAGELAPPEAGLRHVIADPDANDPGWLPAGHEAFDGLAPAGAKFGYNLAQHPDLSRLWPPLPTEAAALILFRAEDAGVGVELPLGRTGLVVVDENGLWWMSDCNGDVPWASDLNTAPSLSSSLVSSSAGADDCPRRTERRLVLYFAKVRYAIDRSVVTSLAPEDAAGPLKFVDCDGNVATTGALFARFTGAFLVGAEDQPGSLALKGIGDDGKFLRGRVTEAIRSKSTRVTLTGSATTTQGEKVYQQGLVELDFDADPDARIINPQVVRVNDARDRYYEDVMFLGLPDGQESGLRYKFKLPAGDAFPETPKLKLRLTLLGLVAGTLPALDLSYRRLPTGSTVPAALPTSDTTLAVTTALAVAADEYVTVESDEFTVAAEDTVLFSLTRAGTGGYNGEVGVLDAVAVLVAG